MRKQEAITLLFIASFFVSIVLFSSPVSASPVTIYSDSYGTLALTTSALKQENPSADSYRSAIAVSFTATNTGYLKSVNVEIIGGTSPISGTLVAYLQGVTNSISADTAIPDGTYHNISIVPSNPLTITNLVTGAGYTEITFYFDGTYQLTSGSNYSLCIAATTLSSIGSSTRYVCFNGKASDTATNTMSEYHNGGWFVDHPTQSMGIYVYGDTVATATPTPTPPGATPTPTAAPTTTPDGMSNVINTIITPNNILLFIALIIIVIPAILGAKFAGGWGFLAGLNVGVVLVVVFSVIPYALWIAVLIGMVDAVAVIRGMTGAGKADTVTKGD